MNNFSLRSFLTSNLEIEEKEILSIQKNCVVKGYPKDAFLLRSNENCQHTFFVEEGLLRQYTIDEKGREFILQFAPEGWFISDPESQYFKRPSRYNIQALEPTKVSFVDAAFINKMELISPRFRDFTNLLLHNQIRHLQTRIELLLTKSAEERYIHFIRTYPDILLRVSQITVASYLGITPESLSRVRRDLARKNCPL